MTEIATIALFARQIGANRPLIGLGFSPQPEVISSLAAY
jgi:hypothetical protein